MLIHNVGLSLYQDALMQSVRELLRSQSRGEGIWVEKTSMDEIYINLTSAGDSQHQPLGRKGPKQGQAPKRVPPPSVGLSCVPWRRHAVLLLGFWITCMVAVERAQQF